MSDLPGAYTVQQNQPFEYVVGGSLPLDAVSYVVRSADDEFFAGLKAGNYCYVLNSRQMGKSSLRIQTKARLQREGGVCVSIDITSFKANSMSEEQLYKAVIWEIIKQVREQTSNLSDWRLLKTLDNWWEERSGFSNLQRWGDFLTEILLTELRQQIVIFLDEIDSISGLPFKDDFFAAIRACYNRRVDDPSFKRLTFALLGVCAPQDLIQDKKRTPFNIGQAIELSGFTEEEAIASRLAVGLPGGVETLRSILAWTGGQPFLTQRVCRVVMERPDPPSPLGKGGDEVEDGDEGCEQDLLVPLPKGDLGGSGLVDQLVIDRIIRVWESNDEQVHFQTIADRMMADERLAGAMLGMYQRVLTEGSVKIDESEEQIGLRLTGVVVKRGDRLCVMNRIYEGVFGIEWVSRKLAALRPYSDEFQQWQESGDKAWLLRGAALGKAKTWANEENRKLAPEDYQFLTASQELEQQDDRNAKVEAESKLIEVESKLVEAESKLIEVEEQIIAGEKRLKIADRRNQKSLIGAGLALAFVAIAVPSSIFSLQQANQAKQEMESAKKQKDELAVKSEQLNARLMETEKKEKDAQQNKEKAEKESKKAQQQAKFSQEKEKQARVRLDQANNALRQVNEEKQVATAAKAEAESAKVTAEQQLSVAKAESEKAIEQQKIAQSDVAKAKITLASAQDERKTILNVSRLEKAGAAALNRSKFEQIKGLLDAMITGEEAYAFNQSKGEEGFTAAPQYALQSILDQVENRAIRLWQNQKILANKLTVYSVKFSPDGQKIGTISRDRDSENDTYTIEVWDTKMGERLLSIPRTDFDTLDFSYSGSPFEFSPDGQYIITNSENDYGKSQIWSIKKGEVVVNLQGHKDVIHAANFSPKGRYVATASWDKTARIWDIETGQERVSLKGHEDAIYSAEFSPDGQHLVTASSDKTARIWDVKTGKEMVKLQGHQNRLYEAKFSPDGQHVITASRDRTVRVWDVKTGRQVVQLQTTHQSRFGLIQFSPNSQQIVTTSGTLYEPSSSENRLKDNLVQVWDAKTGKEMYVLQGHLNSVYSAQFSPNGQYIVTASADRTVRIWDAKTGRELEKLQGHESSVFSAQFSPDGQRIATASWDKTVRLWDLNNPQNIIQFKGHKGSIFSLEFSPNSRQLITTSSPYQYSFVLSDRTDKLWDRKTGQEVHNFKIDDSNIRVMQFSPDGKYFVSASSDRITRIWDVNTGQEVARLQNYEGDVSLVKFSPDNQQIATASSSDTVVRIWDVKTGEEVAKIPGHSGKMILLQFSLDSQRLFTASRQTIGVWSAKTGLRISKGQYLSSEEYNSVDFSPDGERIVTVSQLNPDKIQKTAKIWDVKTGKELLELLGHEDAVYTARFSFNGKRIVTASKDKTARVWDANTGQEIVKLQGHEDRVMSAQFSPDGKYIVTASKDNTARVWDTNTGQEVATLQGHEDIVFAAQFSPDGQYIATGSLDQTARVWPVEDLNKLLSRGCRWLRSYLIIHPDTLQKLPTCQAVLKENEEVNLDNNTKIK
jgi:WD40 repeat protein